MVDIWTKKELSILQDADFLLTKQEITKKITVELNAVAVSLDEIIKPFQNNFKQEYLNKNKKISKGENYLGLPYYVMDYPGYFKKDEVFAYRIMIWWGKEISFTLHLGGIAKSKYEQQIQSKKHEIGKYFMCVNEQAWEHHFNQTNYLLIAEMDEKQFTETIGKKEFVKISSRIHISEIGCIEEHASKHLSHYLHVLFDFDQK